MEPFISFTAARCSSKALFSCSIHRGKRHQQLPATAELSFPRAGEQKAAHGKGMSGAEPQQNPMGSNTAATQTPLTGLGGDLSGRNKAKWHGMIMILGVVVAEGGFLLLSGRAGVLGSRPHLVSRRAPWAETRQRRWEAKGQVLALSTSSLCDRRQFIASLSASVPCC